MYSDDEVQRRRDTLRFLHKDKNQSSSTGHVCDITRQLSDMY